MALDWRTIEGGWNDVPCKMKYNLVCEERGYS